MTMPSKTSIHHWRAGTELSDQARPRDAINEFTIAIELNPEWPLPYFWRAGEYKDLHAVEQWEHDGKWVPRETLEDFGILTREDEGEEVAQ